MGGHMDVRGQRPENQRPAPSDLSVQRSASRAPEPRALLGPGMVRGYGMTGTRRIQQSIPKLATASRPPWATRSPDATLGTVAIMRARAIIYYRDCELAEIPRPQSRCDNGRAERKTVSPYACRGPVLMLSADNDIGQSVAEHPSRLELPRRGVWAGFFIGLTPNYHSSPEEV
jgi:hypothetical protein